MVTEALGLVNGISVAHTANNEEERRQYDDCSWKSTQLPFDYAIPGLRVGMGEGSREQTYLAGAIRACGYRCFGEHYAERACP